MKLVHLAHLPDEESAPIPANVMIVMVCTNTLKPWPGNPAARMTTRTLLPLRRIIEQEGFDPFRPILVSKDGYIGDGHRRWLVAKALKIERVPVVFTDRTVQELWACNAGARPVSAREWMAVNVIGGVSAPKGTTELIEEMRPIMGDEGLRYLIERGVAPTIWKITCKIGVYCGRRDNKFLRQTTYWLVKHKMSDKVKKAMYGPEEERAAPSLIVQVIENDLSLRTAWAWGE